MNTYGLHSIHGRSPAVATGVALARPDLDVWVIGGDGDMLSIGGNHLIHALRRNVSLKIIMFNNQIYGLTKGQYSPTSEVGKITKSSPFGSLDTPFNPISVALAAEATFVARTHDMDRKGMMEAFRRAHEHQGSAFVEIYQNCNVFNDGAFDLLRDKPSGTHNQIRLVDGQPIVFDEGTRCVSVGSNGRLEIALVADTPRERIVVHDAQGDPSLAFSLAHLASGPTHPTPIGVFRDVERSVYGEAIHRQIESATERLGPGDLEGLLNGGDTWSVEPRT
jgi:2-oxoglutarate ferredoxin oxidoreductase subunit beta